MMTASESRRARRASRGSLHQAALGAVQEVCLLRVHGVRLSVCVVHVVLSPARKLIAMQSDGEDGSDHNGRRSCDVFSRGHEFRGENSRVILVS